MGKWFRHILTVLILTAGPLLAQGQTTALKTNLLYWGTGTLNMGAEYKLNEKSTVDFQAGFNPWNMKGSETNDKKIAHWIIKPEYRYWFEQSFQGHYIGAHPFFAKYNIGGHKIPLLLEKESNKYRYEGNMFGFGFSYGYHLPLYKNLHMEFTLGVGYAHMKYDKFYCAKCGDKIGREKRNYVGPTRAGVSLVYVFNK